MAKEIKYYVDECVCVCSHMYVDKKASKLADSITYLEELTLLSVIKDMLRRDVEIIS